MFRVDIWVMNYQFYDPEAIQWLLLAPRTGLPQKGVPKRALAFVANFLRSSRELFQRKAMIAPGSVILFVETKNERDSLLFLALNALNVVLIVLLIYLISRSFVKLIFERRSGALGSHLNLKFALALFLVAAIPMGLQYVVSSSFITASIDTWFSLQMDRAIDDSRD